MNINRSLDFYMDRDGLIQTDLWRIGKFSPNTISLIRNNHRPASIETIVIFSKMFGVKVSEFIAVGEDASEQT